MQLFAQFHVAFTLIPYIFNHVCESDRIALSGNVVIGKPEQQVHKPLQLHYGSKQQQITLLLFVRATKHWNTITFLSLNCRSLLLLSVKNHYLLTVFTSISFSICLIPRAHPGGLFGYHDWPLCAAGLLHSTKADDKTSDAVTAGL